MIGQLSQCACMIPPAAAMAFQTASRSSSAHRLAELAVGQEHLERRHAACDELRDLARRPARLASSIQQCSATSTALGRMSSKPALQRGHAGPRPRPASRSRRSSSAARSGRARGILEAIRRRRRPAVHQPVIEADVHVRVDGAGEHDAPARIDLVAPRAAPGAVTAAISLALDHHVRVAFAVRRDHQAAADDERRAHPPGGGHGLGSAGRPPGHPRRRCSRYSGGSPWPIALSAAASALRCARGPRRRAPAAGARRRSRGAGTRRAARRPARASPRPRRRDTRSPAAASRRSPVRSQTASASSPPGAGLTSASAQIATRKPRCITLHSRVPQEDRQLLALDLDIVTRQLVLDPRVVRTSARPRSASSASDLPKTPRPGRGERSRRRRAGRPIRRSRT